MSAVNTSLSGIQAGIELLNTTAHNVSNLNTDGYKKLETNFSEARNGGVTVSIGEGSRNAQDPTYKVLGSKKIEKSNVDLVEEGVGTILANYQVKANIEAFKAAVEMKVSIFDILA